MDRRSFFHTLLAGTAGHIFLPKLPDSYKWIVRRGEVIDLVEVASIAPLEFYMVDGDHALHYGCKPKLRLVGSHIGINVYGQ